MRRVLVSVAAAASMLSGSGCRRAEPVPVVVGTAGPPPALEANAVVKEVIDGDTLVVRIAGADERVRLLGIDSPETKDRDGPVQCFGPEATAATAALLPAGTRVRLERDVEARDLYDRLLVYVFRADDALFVNLELARGGYVRPLWIAPNRAYAPELDAAIADARRAGRGLWGGCPADDPGG